jgi:hypothetical protein
VSPFAESRNEPVKLAGEERLESHYGFWQGSRDDAVACYLACGVWGSARSSRLRLRPSARNSRVFSRPDAQCCKRPSSRAVRSRP